MYRVTVLLDLCAHEAAAIVEACTRQKHLAAHTFFEMDFVAELVRVRTRDRKVLGSNPIPTARDPRRGPSPLSTQPPSHTYALSG